MTPKITLLAMLLLAAALVTMTGCVWNTPMVIAYRSSISIGGQGSNTVSSTTHQTGGGTATAELPLAK